MHAFGRAQRPGGRWTGLLVPGSGLANNGRRQPVTRPAFGTLGPRRPVRRALGPPSAILPVAEVESQQPGNFSLYSRIVCAVCNAFSSRTDVHLELVHVRAEQVTLEKRHGAALARGRGPQRDLTKRLASSRKVGRVYNTRARAKQTTDSRAGLKAAVGNTRGFADDTRRSTGDASRIDGHLEVRRRFRAASLGLWGLNRSAPQPPEPERKPRSESLILSL